MGVGFSVLSPAGGLRPWQTPQLPLTPLCSRQPVKIVYSSKDPAKSKGSSKVDVNEEAEL